ncbi:MAG TPA: glutamyl-tRNA reductase [Mucilaginibacter sp.]
MKTINRTADIRNFYVIGISYKKTDADNRGKFAISSGQYEALLKRANSYGINSVFVLSTCNRTEIYGLTDNANKLIDLLCSVTVGEKNEFAAYCYVKENVNAVKHLFNVAAGLDSQILGDYEIVGQLKQAVKFAKERGFIDSFLEKLYNTALQASKQVKNQTGLSKGTTSVSFATAQLIKKHSHFNIDSKILLVGAGKMARLTCKNLTECLGKVSITVVNRSVDRARAIAGEMNADYATVNELNSLIGSSHIIIVATGAPYPIILKRDLECQGKKLIIDLSMPYNVDPEAAKLSHIDLVNIDEISLINIETLERRQEDVCAAQKINEYFIDKFMEWCEIRKSLLLVNTIKGKLTSICVGQSKLADGAGISIPFEEQQKIQQILNETATKMKSSNQAGCHYLEALNDLMSPQFLAQKTALI